MQTLSKVILIGYIGTEPETKTIGNAKVTSFSLATEESYKDKEGEKKSETEWHNIEFWGNEKLIPFLKKGAPVSIVGKNKTDKWEKEIGTEKVKFQKTKVVADEIGLLDSKKD
jgi:single-strand DNA-binding protein